MQVMNITKLPPEVLVGVMEKLEGGEQYINLLMTCRLFFDILKSEPGRERLLFEIALKRHFPSEFKFRGLKDSKIRQIICETRVARRSQLFRKKTITLTNFIPFKMMVVVTVVLITNLAILSLVPLSWHDQACYDKCARYVIQYQDRCEQECSEPEHTINRLLAAFWITLEVGALGIIYLERKHKYGECIRDRIIHIGEVVGKRIELIKDYFNPPNLT